MSLKDKIWFHCIECYGDKDFFEKDTQDRVKFFREHKNHNWTAYFSLESFEEAIAELKKKGRKCEVCPKFTADKCRGVKGKAYWFCGKDFNEVLGKEVK